MSDAEIRVMPDPATSVEAIVKTRSQAWAIKRILDRNSFEVVGWLYEWNTGEQEPRWKNGKREDVVYE